MKASTAAPARFVVVGMLLATGARASEEFPLVVQNELGVKKAPDCTLCHQTELGGENTATQPFGRTMQKFGAVKKNDDSLKAALDRDDSEGTDSDGDCIPDTDELRAGTNPNVADVGDGGQHCEAPALPPTLQTGCSVSSRSRNTYAAAVIAGASWLILARGRGRSRAGARRSGRFRE